MERNGELVHTARSSAPTALIPGLPTLMHSVKRAITLATAKMFAGSDHRTSSTAAGHAAADVSARKPDGGLAGSFDALTSIAKTGVATHPPASIADDSLRAEVPLEPTTSALTHGPGGYQPGEMPFSDVGAAPHLNSTQNLGGQDFWPSAEAVPAPRSTLDPQGTGSLRTNAIRDLDAFLAAGAGREMAAGRPPRESPRSVAMSGIAAYAPDASAMPPHSGSGEGASDGHTTQYGTLALSPRSAVTVGAPTTLGSPRP